MALYQINMTLRDEDNDSASMQFNVNAADEVAAVARANALATLIDALSGAAITGLAVSRNLSLAGLQATPTADIDIEKGLRLVFATDFAGVNPYVTIPGILPSMVIPPGVLDDSQTAWDDFFTEIFTTGDYQDYRGAGIVSLRTNYETHNGKKRG